jgi:excisionase family DNA binding protein
MPVHRQSSPEERLLGAEAAADHLRIHRSTLHLAVRQGMLVPDTRTPGGHVRFRRETLDAYCARLGIGSSVTGESAAAAPLRALAELARLLVANEALEVVGAAAVAGMRRALPGIDACAVAMVQPEPGDPFVLQPFAHFGLPEQVRASYRQLRRTFRFASTTALRTLEPEICENAAARQLYTGTQRFARLWQLGAYALFPITASGEPLGLLLCLSHASRRFSASERAFLQAMADQLALAIQQALTRQHGPSIG